MRILGLVALLLAGLICTSAEAANANLRWQPPVEREDGTPLASTELAGYYVYYGQDATLAVAEKLWIPNGDTTTKTITDLGRGSWHFAVTAVDTRGLESIKSSIVTLNVPKGRPGKLQTFEVLIP